MFEKYRDTKADEYARQIAYWKAANQPGIRIKVEAVEGKTGLHDSRNYVNGVDGDTAKRIILASLEKQNGAGEGCSIWEKPKDGHFASCHKDDEGKQQVIYPACPAMPAHIAHGDTILEENCGVIDPTKESTRKATDTPEATKGASETPVATGKATENAVDSGTSTPTIVPKVTGDGTLQPTNQGGVYENNESNGNIGGVAVFTATVITAITGVRELVRRRKGKRTS